MKLFKKAVAQEKLLYDILDSSAPFELKEAFNSLCTNVLYSANAENLKKLAVSSSVYGEGKTSVAINLASAFACNLIDKKILLIDADLRTPHVAEFLGEKLSGASSAIGLSEYLVGTAEIPTILKTNLPNMDVVLAGGATMNPAGLMNSARMKDFLNSCAESYDYVIIDTPPLNVVSDALLLIGDVDGYIIAAKNKFSKIPLLDATQSALNSVGANILGIVLTEIKK